MEGGGKGEKWRRDGETMEVVKGGRKNGVKMEGQWKMGREGILKTRGAGKTHQGKEREREGGKGGRQTANETYERERRKEGIGEIEVK